jgi:hypothetical protein
MPRSTNKPVVTKPSFTTPVLSIQQPSLFSNIKQGFGFGVGSSIAHNIFDSKDSRPQPPIDKTREFKLCMEKTYNNYDECSAILN